MSAAQDVADTHARAASMMRGSVDDIVKSVKDLGKHADVIASAAVKDENTAEMLVQSQNTLTAAILTLVDQIPQFVRTLETHGQQMAQHSNAMDVHQQTMNRHGNALYNSGGRF